MRLHRGRAIEAVAGRRARADRLVILISRVAEGEIVHRALRRAEHAERAIETIDDGLAGLDIAGGNRSGVTRLQHRALRHDDLDGTEAAGVERNLLIHQRAEYIKHASARDRLGGIEGVGDLRAGAGEIDGRFARLLIDLDGDLDDAALVGLDL